MSNEIKAVENLPSPNTEYQGSDRSEKTAAKYWGRSNQPNRSFGLKPFRIKVLLTFQAS